jgi:hypothetical protein
MAWERQREERRGEGRGKEARTDQIGAVILADYG